MRHCHNLRMLYDEWRPKGSGDDDVDDDVDDVDDDDDDDDNNNNWLLYIHMLHALMLL